MKKITIKKIAKLARVSVGTVDRVLHNRGEVAESTKQLVLKIAKEGNYSTNVFARNLKLNKVYNLAVILPKDNEYWEILNGGIENAVAEYESLGMQLSFFTFNRHNKDSFITRSNQAIKSKPDGVIMAPLLEQEAKGICKRLNQQHIPFVFVDSNLENVQPLAFIGQDTRKSGYLAAKLLNYGFAQGHRAFVVKFTDFDSLNKTITERIEGFRRYYSDNKFNPELIEEVTVQGDQLIIEDLIKNRSSVCFFLPNSRAYQVANLLAVNDNRYKFRVVGYDLITENIECLTKDTIDFIIHQNPAMQGNLSIQAFYKHLILKEPVEVTQKMPLDIITKENVAFEKK
ncbi:MAG: substrate-binding domain-containing protein [Cyclobacteriaceae bacterium]|nr:substrate-binding domain-containing protein [Cyclobacteriaceae bacterium]